MSHVTQRIALSIQVGVPVLWIGKPGIGKTAICDGIAKKLGKGFASLSITQIDPTDIGGLPMPDTMNPNLIRRRFDDWAWAVHTEPTLLLLDEINRGSALTMNASLRVLQERMIGSMPFHEGSAVIATANPPDHPGAREIPDAMANRMYHESGEIEFDEWQSFMLGGQGATANIQVIPDNWADNYPQAAARVMGYLNAHRDMTYKMPSDPVLAGGPWPSNRSWHNATKVLAAGMSIGNIELAYDVMTGIVGAGAMQGFIAFIKNVDLPDPEGILIDPTTFPVTGRADRLIAISFSVVAAARNTAHKEFLKRYKVVESIVLMLDKANRKDIAFTMFAGMSAAFADGKRPHEFGYVPSVEFGKAMMSTNSKLN